MQHQVEGFSKWFILQFAATLLVLVRRLCSILLVLKFNPKEFYLVLTL